ncbi:hypothetical protein ACPCTG_32150 [Streptomyces pseudogriseolus]
MHQHTPDWHAHEESTERAWLDSWARGHINPDTLTTPDPELAAA